MIGNSLITQIVVAGLAIGIIITYIKPSITEVGILQDKIAKTTEELDKVNAVKSKLAALVSDAGAISPKDKQLLSIYMPETIDEVEVMKDLEAIANDSGVKVNSLSYNGEVAVTADITEEGAQPVELPMGHTFSLDISSSYEQMKYLLLLLEKNNYPLDIQELSISPTEGGLLDLSLDVRTYSYK